MLCTCLSALALSGCATGGSGGDDTDAPKADTVDAPPGAIDAPRPIDAPPPVDAPPGPIDAPLPVDAPASTAPDTCAQAQDLTATAFGAGVTVTGDTTTFVDDVTTPSSCTGYTADGPDAIYQVNLVAGQTLTATATPTTAWDISLELVTPCAQVPTCLDGSDLGFGGDPELLLYTSGVAQTVYLVVDGYNPGIAGAYSLTVRVQ